MKSFPICWTKTLAQLGLRRKVRKSSSKWRYGRRPLFENLETRQMLTVSGPVNTLLDVVNANDGLYSLREAIISANASSDVDTITFAPGLEGTIVLNGTQLPNIAHPLTIDGLGADKLAISGNGTSRVFRINSGVNVAIRGLAISDGSSNEGGGIYNDGGTLTLENTVVSNNTSTDYGGGLYSKNGNVTILASTFAENLGQRGGGFRFQMTENSVLTIDSSTFVGNKAIYSGNAGYGGAIFVSGGNTTTPAQIRNSTFSDNFATTRNGGLRIDGSKVQIFNSTITLNRSANLDGGIGISGTGASATLHNTIVAGNIAQANPNFNEIAGSLNVASSYNLFGPGGTYNGTNNTVLQSDQSAGLAPLGDYGGPTKTHALLPGSPAIDRGNSTHGATKDQRGFARQVDDTATANNPGQTVDIGAFEVPLLLPSGDVDGDHRDDEIRHDPWTGSLQVTTFPSGQPKVAIWGQLDEVANFIYPQVSDFNGDGRDDLLIKRLQGNSTWRIAISDGSQFVIHDTGFTGSWATRYVGDFDGDGSEELLGKLSNGTWQVLRYSDANDAQLDTLTGTMPTLTGTVFVGDADRDGRDDLIERISDTSWNVWLAQPGGTSFASATNWGEWFKAEYVAGNLDFISASYQKVLNIFSDIYNNYELELYPGLMKGPDATEQTKAGNDWDQAALLVKKLEAAGVDADIASGTVSADGNLVASWVGAETPSAALDMLKLSLHDGASLNTSSGKISFTHAWVQVTLPFSIEQINLDPSWKFKNRQSGIDLVTAQFNNGNAQGIFDEYEYLSLDPTNDKRLPLEFFEDRVMDFLAGSPQYQGNSLSDLSRNGSIIAKNFENFSQAVDAEVTFPVSPSTYENAEYLYNISDTDTAADNLTHRAIISLYKGGTKFWDYTLVVPKHSLDSIVISFASSFADVGVPGQPEPGKFAPPTPGNFFGRLVINGTVMQAAEATESFGLNDEVTITVQHLNATGVLDPQMSAEENTLTYSRKPTNIVSIGFDANQYSRDSLTELQDSAVDDAAALVAKIKNNNSQTSNDIGVAISSLLSYSVAKYWGDLNRDNEVIAGLTNTVVMQQFVGSGVTTADVTLLQFDVNNTPSNSNDDVKYIEHLNYGYAPAGMGIDLPLSQALFHFTNLAAFNNEAFQLAGYNASAREHNVVEEMIYAEGISTIKGLQNAFQKSLGVDSSGDAIADDSILVFERNAAGQKRYLGEFNKSGSSVGQVQVIMPMTQLADVAGKIPRHMTGGVNHAANEIWAELNAATDDQVVRVLVPKSRSKVGNWIGSVYLIESPRGTLYAISQNGQSTQGGASGDQVRAGASSLIAPSAAIPVNTANGAMIRDDVDIVFPNLGVPLDFTRHYDSGNKDDYGLGVGWVHSFGDYIIDDPDPNAGTFDLIWITSTGQRHKLKSLGSGLYEVPASLYGVFAYDSSDSKFKYKDKSGLEYHFENASLPTGARLQKIIDNIGNGVEVIYHAPNSRNIQQVRDIHPSSNRKLQFEYTNNVISKIHKYDGGTQPVGTWNYTYRSPKIDSKNHLESVASPSVNVAGIDGQESPTTLETIYTYYDSGQSKGLIETITEPDDSIHTYEYFVNGRVFRVTDTNEHERTFDYNLLRGSTEFVDENGNTETYFHQENGLLKKQIHDDRTRLEFTWGKVGTPVEFLMTSSTDEVGAIETFRYYVTDSSYFQGADDQYEYYITSNTFRNRELYEATAKRFPNGPALITRFDYSSPGGQKAHMVNLWKSTVSPGVNDIVTEFQYNALGQLITTIDPAGTTTRTYYQTGDQYLIGLLKTEERPHDGIPGVTTFNYDAVGNVTKAQTDSIPTTESKYDHTGSLIETKNSSGLVIGTSTIDVLGRASAASLHPTAAGTTITSTFAYDAFGRVRKSTDPLGRVTTFEYDPKGQLMVQKNPDGTQVSYEYDGVGNRTSVTDELGNTTRFFYDGRNRLIQTIYSDGTSARLRYNAMGQIAATIDDRNNETRFTYDAAGRLLKTFNAENDFAENQYDLLGRLHIAIDFKGNQTKFKYDKLGRVTESRILSSSGTAILALTTTDYDSNGNITRIARYDAGSLGYAYNSTADPRNYITTQNETDNKVQVTKITYDALNRPTITTNSDGTGTSTEYDNDGRVQYQYDELNRRTEFQYDAYGRLWKSIAPDPDGNGPLQNPETENYYDAAGNLVKVIDPRENITQFTYDLRNRLVTRTDAFGNQTHTIYDLAGRMVATVDALGHAMFTLRDKRGRAILSREADPDGNGELTAPETRFDYDDAGNVEEKIDALGFTTRYFYDDLNRLEREEVITSYVIDEGDPDYSVYYSSNGQGELGDGFLGDSRLLSVPAGSLAAADWDFKNLPAGTYRILVTWTPRPGEQNVTQSMSAQILLNGSGTPSVTVSNFDGNQELTPDDVYRFDEGTPRGWGVVSQGYTLASDAMSFKIRLRSANGKKLLADAVRLERIDTRSYTYDDNGNLETETDTLGRVTTYLYDALNRQTKITLPDPDGSGSGGVNLPAPFTTTVYDAYGNVKTETEDRGGGANQRVTAYEYDRRNRLTLETLDKNGAQQVATKFEYDDVGNLKVRIEDYGGIAARTEYDYDNLDRQKEVRRYRDTGDQYPLQTLTTYDAASNVLTTTEKTRYEVAPRTHEHLATTKFTYDALNRLSTSTVEDGITWAPLHAGFNVTGGTLSVRLSNTTSNKIVIADAIRIDRLGPSGEILETRIIDDDKTLTDPRFTAGPGTLTDTTGITLNEYGGDTTFTGPVNTNAARFAIWTFTGLTAGTYRVSATWVTDSNYNDQYAKYELFNGVVDSSPDATKLIDQRMFTRDIPGSFSGATTKFTYDAVGNLVAERNPNGQVTTSEYDNLNRLVKTTAPDPDGILGSGLPSSVEYTYDAFGQLIRETNGEGETRSYVYDAQGNLIRETDGLGQTTGKSTLSTYDSEGNLLTYTDPEGNKTTYTYDRLNRVKTDTIKLAGVDAIRTYTYNAQGNLSGYLDRDNRKTTYQYDRLDRVTHEYWWNVTHTAGIHLVHHQYDKLGRVVWAADMDYPTGVYSYVYQTYDYDDLGRVTKARNYRPDVPSHTPGPKVEQRFEYDVPDYGISWANDSTPHVLTKVSQWSFNGTSFDPNPIGTTVTFVDKHGRTARIDDTVTGQATKRVEFTYDDADQLVDVARKSGSFFFDTRYGYDNAGRVTKLEHWRDDDPTWFTQYLYAYDKADRIRIQGTLHDTAIAALSQVPAAQNEYFTFDDAGQLVLANKIGSSDDESFAYDSNGNRTGTELGTDPYNRLAEDADWVYTYDKEGNLKRKDAKVGTAYVEYEYDHRNRLVFVRHIGPEYTDHAYRTYYRYDTDDQLVTRRWEFTPGNPQPVDPLQIERFIYQGNHRVLTFDGETNKLAHRYTWGPGRDQLLTDEVFDAGGAWDETLWAATDHLGSVRELLDSTEEIIEHRDYTSFGEIDSAYDVLGNSLLPADISTGYQLTLASHSGYTGKFFDAATGLQYNNARWYDPAIGRFLNEDPIGFADGSNPYRYAGNDPVNFTDPTGLSQAGHPLSNFSLNVSYGGYSGGRVAAAPPPVYVSPTMSYNPLAAPTFSSQQLFGGTPSIKAPSSTLVPLAFPNAVNYAGISQSLANDLSRIQMGQHFAGVTDWLREANINTRIEAARYRPAEGPSLLSQVGNVISSFGSGLTTGGKAVVNSLASTVTLGFYDGPAQVTRQDINNGYNAARFSAGVGTETLVGLATGGLSRLGAAGKAIFAFDTVGNVVNAGRGGLDAYNNGFSLGNSVQIVGGAAGLGGNIATGGRTLQEIASDASRVRVSFDPATVSAGGLGGVKVYLAPAGPLQAGQAGRFADLKALATVGDDLTPHHMPQAARGFTNHADGGAIVIPHSQHVLTRTYGTRGAKTAIEEVGLTFRDTLARDIRDLRRIAGSAYNQGIQNLLEYYRQALPGLMQKPK